MKHNRRSPGATGSEERNAYATSTGIHSTVLNVTTTTSFTLRAPRKSEGGLTPKSRMLISTSPTTRKLPSESGISFTPNSIARVTPAIVISPDACKAAPSSTRVYRVAR